MTNVTSWRPIFPVQADITIPDIVEKRLGPPTTTYTYRDRLGRLLGYVCRFDMVKDGKREKMIKPYFYGSFDEKEPGWAFQGPFEKGDQSKIFEKFCLYNAQELAKKPTSKILVVEGEKTADAAKIIFPEHLVVTSIFGAGSAHKSDWDLVKGRDVVIWPDNDKAGQAYASKVAKAGIEAGAREVRIVTLPKAFPDHWDLADELPESLGQDDLIRLTNEAKVYGSLRTNSQQSSGLPSGYRLTETHVEYVEASEEGEAWIPLCSYLEVRAYTRDSNAENWGRQLFIKAPEGNLHQWSMPMSLTAGDGTGYREHLLDLGLQLISSKGSKERLSNYITMCNPSETLTCVARIGWHHDNRVFVLPELTIGSDMVVFQPKFNFPARYGSSGTLEHWKHNVGRLCEGNSRLIMALGTAFAAPLLAITQMENGGFHFEGPSSIGKTTTLKVAASVWGGGTGLGGYIQSWRATANGLESVATFHCDTLLCLDEIGQALPNDVGEAAYMLANGVGKSRATRQGSAQRSNQWRVLFLSNGETSLSGRMKEGSKTATSTAGQEVRIVNIQADAGKGYGIFETLHEFDSSNTLAKHLSSATSNYFGVASKEFLAKLVQIDSNDLKKAINHSASDFSTKMNIDLYDGQIKRVAQRFALLYAAGILAHDFAILPCTKASIYSGIKACFDSWLFQRGGSGPLEEQRLLQHVRYFLEQHGQARFENYNESPGEFQRTITNRAGVVRKTDQGEEYFVLPETFKQEICKGFSLKLATEILIKHGWLVPGEGNRAARNERLPPKKGTTRCYRLTPKVFQTEIDHDDIRMGSVMLDGNTGNEGSSPKENNDISELNDSTSNNRLAESKGSGNELQLFPNNGSFPNGSLISAVSESASFKVATGVPDVPTASTMVEFIAKSFSRLRQAATDSSYHLNAVDDMSARCINQIGGWDKFSKLCRTEAQKAEELFFEKFVKLSRNKKNGDYDSDNLPMINGPTPPPTTYRVKWSEIESENQDFI